MAKKISLTKNQIKQLGGFEEVIDLITDEKIDNSKQRRSQVEDYELFNYLEKEVERLSKIDLFFKNQVRLMKNFPQTPALIDDEKLELDTVKQLFVKKIMSEPSTFYNNMDTMFISVFNRGRSSLN